VTASQSHEYYGSVVFTRCSKHAPSLYADVKVKALDARRGGAAGEGTPSIS